MARTKAEVANRAREAVIKPQTELTAQDKKDILAYRKSFGKSVRTDGYLEKDKSGGLRIRKG